MKVFVLIIFIGGAFGAMVREFIVLLVPQMHNGFPLNIFVANIVASFLLGVATHKNKLKKVSDEALLLFGTGVLGGMSTFSTFVYGAFSELITPKGIVISMLYIVSSMVCGFIAVWVGFKLAADLSDAKSATDTVETTQLLEKQIAELQQKLNEKK